MPQRNGPDVSDRRRPAGLFLPAGQTMQDASFSDLIERLRGGDTAAAEEFMCRYGEAIRRETRFMLLDARLRRIVAESDVCQSVVMRFFVDLWAGKYEFERPADLMGLLKKMVRARVVDLARHWTAQRRDLRRNVATGDGLDSHLAVEHVTPSRIVAHGELLEQIRARLSNREQEILGLRQQRLGWQEIAGRIGGGSGPEAIRKQYERALARVSKELNIEE